MNDHDAIIELSTKMDMMTDTLSNINARTSTMNSEQGMQAVEIAELGVTMSYIQAQNWFIITCIVAAIISQVIKSVTKKKDKLDK